MFGVGDKVVYPMHGAGIIEAIEEKDFLGEKRIYYVVYMPVGDMKVMVPVSQVEQIGLREVVDEDTANQVLQILGKRCDDDQVNWHHRYRANLDKIKSGDLFEVAEVVRSLMIRDGARGLSTGERKMLENAKQILISELALVKNLERDQAFSLVEETVYVDGKGSKD
jgi:CarD family transcriptional regulator